MLIAHLPAGYLVTRLLPASQALTTGILLGSIAPDLDMFWFYFVDGGSVHHHEYIPHRPLVWGVLLLLGWLWHSSFLKGAGIGGLVHMMLDSISGGIAWSWPLSSELKTLVTVQPTHSHWILSFVFHWTFLLEIAIVICALFVFISSRKGER